ncbi:MAG: GntR family transcriptional regulator [Beutenbergiaceae bacterium]
MNQDLWPDAGFRGQARGRPAQTLEGTTPAISISSRTRARISDLVYEELSEAIRSLRLPPGAPLSEPAVAAWLEVSRAPVREAFTRLADQRLITIVPQVGSRVAPISLSGVEDAVFIRYALEKAAFEQAVEIDDLDVRDMQEVVYRNREAAHAGDTEAFFASDEQLHQMLFSVAGVGRMWQVVRGTKIELDRMRHLHLETAMADAEVVAEHQQLIDALKDRDVATGAAVIYRHSHRVLTDTGSTRTEHPEFFVP